nr:hypothetical protein GCM10020185_81360 [Pseudomonas brassicacearum subsp. brassicacearum]
MPKVFGVDELARCLDRFGIARYLVGIDGEMRARGNKPDGQPWVVALEKPRRGVREVMGVMELSDAAIATSGDYRHWVDVCGQSFAHTMNPATGTPLCNALAAVTVVSTSCMLADAWATALMVLGETQGPPPGTRTRDGRIVRHARRFAAQGNIHSRRTVAASGSNALTPTPGCRGLRP